MLISIVYTSIIYDGSYIYIYYMQKLKYAFSQIILQN